MLFSDHLFDKLTIFFLSNWLRFVKVSQDECRCQPIRCLYLTGILQKTRPLVIARLVDNADSDRVKMDIAGKLQCVFISFYQYSFVTALEKMSGSLAFCVEIVCVCAVYMLHYLGEVA